MFYKKLWTC